MTMKIASLLLMVGLASTTSSFAASVRRSVSAPVMPPVVSPSHPIRPPTAQRIFAPLPSGVWTDAEIILNNNSPSDSTVKPILYRNGIGASGKSVTLRPSEVRWVKLSEFNEPTGRELTTNDGLELSSQGHMLELGAQVILL